LAASLEFEVSVTLEAAAWPASALAAVPLDAMFFLESAPIAFFPSFFAPFILSIFAESDPADPALPPSQWLLASAAPLVESALSVGLSELAVLFEVSVPFRELVLFKALAPVPFKLEEPLSVAFTELVSAPFAELVLFTELVLFKELAYVPFKELVLFEEPTSVAFTELTSVPFSELAYVPFKEPASVPLAPFRLAPPAPVAFKPDELASVLFTAPAPRAEEP